MTLSGQAVVTGVISGLIVALILRFVLDSGGSNENR